MNWYDARNVLDSPAGLMLTLPAAAVRRPEFILNPRHLNYARVKTTPTFDLLSQAVTRYARQTRAPFVFQTQGLFNAHLDGKPHFVYTDYTERANLRGQTDYQLMPARWLRREQKLYDQADLIFAASTTAQKSLVEDYAISPDKVVLVHTGINVVAPSDPPQRSVSATNILFIGGDWERKGGPELLRAFGRLHQEIPAATLTIIGLTSRSEPRPGVRYLGKVSPDAITRYLADATIFCLPAYHEPAGIAYSEASAWGLPVVATTAGDIPDRVLNDRTGLLIKPGDVDALYDALRRLALDAPLRERLGATGRAYTLENFTWSRIAAKIAAAIRPHLGRAAYEPGRAPVRNPGKRTGSSGTSTTRSSDAAERSASTADS